MMHFLLLLGSCCMEFHETLNSSSTQSPLQILWVFFNPIRQTRWVQKALISWCILWLLLPKCCVEFHRTLQKAGTQSPLPSLCSWTWSVHQDRCQGLWLADISWLPWVGSLLFSVTVIYILKKPYRKQLLKVLLQNGFIKTAHTIVAWNDNVFRWAIFAHLDLLFIIIHYFY